jgi:hypothetical protein
VQQPHRHVDSVLGAVGHHDLLRSAGDASQGHQPHDLFPQLIEGVGVLVDVCRAAEHRVGDGAELSYREQAGVRQAQRERDEIRLLLKNEVEERCLLHGYSRSEVALTTGSAACATPW